MNFIYPDKCPCCGDSPYPGKIRNPLNDTYMPCPVCKGDGKVMKELGKQ